MSTFFGFILLGLAVVIYLLPAIVAHKRRHVNRTSISVLTVLAGWTALGWVVAMVWAFTANVEKSNA